MIWGIVLLLLDSATDVETFLREQADEVTPVLSDGIVSRLLETDDLLQHLRLGRLVRLAGVWCSPADQEPGTRMPHDLSDAIRGFIRLIGDSTNPDAGRELSALIEDPALSAWHVQIRHARAQHARAQRDNNFRHPSVVAMIEALGGGPPINALDLRAVLNEELQRLNAELHTSDETPWKRYWILDGSKAVRPLEENQCRDNLLSRLRDRLKPYGINALLPEARRGEETRADMLVVSGAGRNLPIEAKRHFHKEVWTAASTQLPGYASESGADGMGIYLVFWFGNDAHPAPARPDGSAGPSSAADMRRLLEADLSADLVTRTDVIVFDVARPGAKPAKPRRKVPRSPAGRKDKLAS